MFKISLSFLAAYGLLGVVGVILILFVVPVGTTKDIYATIPSAVYGPSINKASISGRFLEAGNLLAKQAILAEVMGFNKTMKQNLVSQTFAVVERMNNKRQFEHLLPWLKRLSQISPKNHSANLMLVTARIRAGKAVDELKLQELRKVVPSLDTIYRAAIEQAVNQGRNISIGKWCQLYFISQLGALNPETFKSSLVPGQGLGGFFLELVNRQGENVAIANYGIQLNEFRNYKFESHNLPSQTRLNLQLPTLPGLKVTIHQINFITRGSIVSFPGEELLLLPKRGFLIAKNQSLVTSSAGERLTIYPNTSQFPPSNKIQLVLKFDRLPIFNHRQCIGNDE
jgi:hypothetical protein